MSEKTIVNKVEPYIYTIPNYGVIDGKGIMLMQSETLIQFVRGSKVTEENVTPKLNGVLVEQLLEVCLQHLKDVNVGSLATRETSLAITAIEEAQLRLLQREINRKKENTLGTYKS